MIFFRFFTVISIALSPVIPFCYPTYYFGRMVRQVPTAQPTTAVINASSETEATSPDTASHADMSDQHVHNPRNDTGAIFLVPFIYVISYVICFFII